MPFECVSELGTTWHSVQATAFPTVPPARCAWCAPTASALVDVSPCVPDGGAGFCAEPWQELHVIEPTSTLPSTCVATLTADEL